MPYRFGSNLKYFPLQVVEGLLLIMDDNENPRVQAHGAAALVNFSDECPKSILQEYLDVILAKLEQVLNNKLQEVSIKSTELFYSRDILALIKPIWVVHAYNGL